MQWKPWVVGGIALVVFDALLVFGVRAYRAAHETPAVESSSQPVDEPVRAVVVPAAPVRPQTACISGETWQFDAEWQRWFKPTPVQPCDLGTVREVFEREGVVRRYPKAPRPSAGHNLTQ